MNEANEMDVDYLNDIWLEETRDNLMKEGIIKSEAEDMASWAHENNVHKNIVEEYRQARRRTEEDTDQKEQDYRRAVEAN